nr:MAG TPA: hypothetical protein [Caudoviricetes sp.]
MTHLQGGCFIMPFKRAMMLSFNVMIKGAY